MQKKIRWSVDRIIGPSQPCRLGSDRRRLLRQKNNLGIAFSVDTQRRMNKNGGAAVSTG